MKKLRERFSIKFNLAAPDHKCVIEILEKQGARNKAPYIVRAVLHYEAEKQRTNGEAFKPMEQRVRAVSTSGKRTVAYKQKNEPATLLDDKAQAKIAKSLDAFFAK